MFFRRGITTDRQPLSPWLDPNRLEDEARSRRRAPTFLSAIIVRWPPVLARLLRLAFLLWRVPVHPRPRGYRTRPLNQLLVP